MEEGRPRSFYVLAIFFAVYVLFLYGPMIAIYVLSFQGPQGGLTFPMNGVSTFWIAKLFQGTGIVDLGAAFRRSLLLGVIVMAVTVVLSVAAGMAFRRKFKAQSILFYSAIASLIVPSIITSLGISLEFRIIDDLIKAHWSENFETSMGLLTSGLGAHLTWTLPVGLLIMFAIFNRFDPRLEEAARDLGATPWQTFRAVNTLPLDLQGLTTTVTNPDIYALGTVISAVSFTVISLALGTIHMLNKRQAAKGSDAGKG